MVGEAATTLFTVNPFGDPVSWITLLLKTATGGDLMAVTFLLVLVYVSILIINKLTDLLLIVISKLMVFAIISSALYLFFLDWMAKVAAGPTAETIILGLVGLLAGVGAFSIALYSLIQSTKHVKKLKEKEIEDKQKEEEDKKLDEARKGVEETKKEVLALREFLTMQTFKDDKSLGAVLAYMAIAQFGIFSSKTISAPSSIIGFVFFVIFLAATGFFIKINYKSYRLGLTHFGVALFVGFVLSIILGVTWGDYSATELISPAYFQTDSLVALMTGIALPIFMGSKK
ncbi:MAG: hypothetical protein ABH950_08805 [Candidatus Altiarchaeota archaeon]